MVKSQRVPLFDLVRGSALLCMIVYHGVYDWALFYNRLPFIYQPWMIVLQALIAWTFIFLSGWMVRFSHDNVLRGLWYLFWALIVFLVTFAAGVDIPITYGILFCLGASTHIVGLLKKARLLPARLAWGVVSFLLFFLLYGIPQQRIGIGMLSAPLPSCFSAIYGHGLAFIGLPSTNFQSGDYFPLVPFFFLYLAGAIVGDSLSSVIYNKRPFNWLIPGINWIGRHSLLLYLIHQPILIGIIWIISCQGIP